MSQPVYYNQQQRKQFYNTEVNTASLRSQKGKVQAMLVKNIVQPVIQDDTLCSQIPDPRPTLCAQINGPNDTALSHEMGNSLDSVAQANRWIAGLAVAGGLLFIGGLVLQSLILSGTFKLPSLDTIKIWAVLAAPLLGVGVAGMFATFIPHLKKKQALRELKFENTKLDIALRQLFSHRENPPAKA